MYKEIRRGFPKGTINNLLYKEMGNSIYGNVVRGISNKKEFDSLTGNTTRVTGTELSNPILAFWTTAFIRSVIGECLHNIQKLGGKTVSVTTDGFITDIEDLEDKLLTLPIEDIQLLTKYRSLRLDLTNGKSPEGLEIKTYGKGVISWTTRGQLGLESGMTATTGFQINKKGDSKYRDDLVTQFKDIIKNKHKSAEYTYKSQRGGKDIFYKGGHVTTKLKERVFRLHPNNRRKLVDSITYDYSKFLLDSQLW